MIRAILVLTILLNSFFSYSQLLKFRSKVLPVNENVSSFQWAAFSSSTKSFNGKYMAIVQFKNNPTNGEKKQLQQAGITLVGYIPDRAFIVSISNTITKQLLQSAGIRSIITIPNDVKFAASLSQVNDTKEKSEANISLLVSFFKGLPVATIINDLMAAT